MSGRRESELGVLGDVAGKDVVELGCGTAYFGAWLARRGASRRRRRRHSGAARDGAADERGDRARARARSRRTRRRCRCRTRRSTWRCPSTAPRSGAIRTSGSPRRPGCCAPAASSSSCATRRSSCSARRTRARSARRSCAPQFGLHRFEWPGEDEGVEFHLAHGEMIRLLRETGSRSRACGAPGDRGRDGPHATTASSRPSGRASGRPRRSGRPASAGERSAGSADAPRLALAAAARDPRAARHSVRRRRAAYEEHGDDPRRARARGQGALRRGRRAQPVLGVDTAVVVDGGRSASRAAPPRRRRCSSGSPAGRTRSSRGSASHAARGRSSTARRRGHVPPADSARPRRLRRRAASGRARRRLRDPGPRRQRSSSGSRATT